MYTLHNLLPYAWFQGYLTLHISLPYIDGLVQSLKSCTKPLIWNMRKLATETWFAISLLTHWSYCSFALSQWCSIRGNLKLAMNYGTNVNTHLRITFQADVPLIHNATYTRKTSSISRTKSQSLNVSCILVQLFLLNPLNPGVKLRMKM